MSLAKTLQRRINRAAQVPYTIPPRTRARWLALRATPRLRAKERPTNRQHREYMQRLEAMLRAKMGH